MSHRWRPLVVGVAGLVLVGCSAGTATSTPDTDPVNSGVEATVEATTVTAEGPAAVPVERGAVARDSPALAAIRFVELREELVSMADEEVMAAIRAVSTPQSAERLGLSSVTELAEANSAFPAGFSLRAAVLESSTSMGSDDSATVEVWFTQVITGGGQSLSVFSNATLVLVLVDGQWLLDAVDAEVGPTPTPANEPTSPELLEAFLAGFTDPVDDLVSP